MAEHIHWRKAMNPKYLGEWDLPDGKDMIVTIKDVIIEEVRNANGTEKKPVIYFEGNIKPMILGNKVNQQRISKVCGSNYYDEWVGHDIQLYTEMVSAYGTTTMALRVRDFAPRKGA